MQSRRAVEGCAALMAAALVVSCSHGHSRPPAACQFSRVQLGCSSWLPAANCCAFTVRGRQPPRSPSLALPPHCRGWRGAQHHPPPRTPALHRCRAGNCGRGAGGQPRHWAAAPVHTRGEHRGWGRWAARWLEGLRAVSGRALLLPASSQNARAPAPKTCSLMSALGLQPFFAGCCPA